jgi:hypothetical protein
MIDIAPVRLARTKEACVAGWRCPLVGTNTAPCNQPGRHALHAAPPLQDREDLIEACLASAHLPLLLDWRPTAFWRGMHCVDGSLLYVLTRHAASHLILPAGLCLLLHKPRPPYPALCCVL